MPLPFQFFVTQYQECCYMKVLKETDKVRNHEKPYVCAMQIRFIITLAFRLIRREKMLFLSIVGVLLFSFIVYGFIFYHVQAANSSLEQQLNHVSFIISVDSSDLKESAEVLRMSPLIDSLTIITPQESTRFVESELGIISDSLLKSADFPSIIAIHPGLLCEGSNGFSEITELCERLPLTDNIHYNTAEQNIYLILYDSYKQTTFFITLLFCTVLLLFSLYTAVIIGKRVRYDAVIFSQVGASAMFSASPWILFFLFALSVGVIIASLGFVIILFMNVSIISEIPKYIMHIPFIVTVTWHCLTLLLTTLLLFFTASRHSFWRFRNDV